MTGTGNETNSFNLTLIPSSKTTLIYIRYEEEEGTPLPLPHYGWVGRVLFSITLNKEWKRIPRVIKGWTHEKRHHRKKQQGKTEILGTIKGRGKIPR